MSYDSRVNMAVQIALADARYVLEWLRQTNAPKNIMGLQEQIITTLTEEELGWANALDTWASRMPDAGFNSDDPRWDWWHERPRR